MDEEVYEMIEDLVDELIDLYIRERGFDKSIMRALLERKIVWVINYTHKDEN